MRKYFKKFSTLHSPLSTPLGFTLVEILVVISLMSILMLTSILTFSSFKKNQSFQIGTADVVALLNRAKSKALNQVKPEDCGTNSLQGYQVTFVPTGTSYKLESKCGDILYAIETKNLPSDIVFADTSSSSAFFNVATGIVDSPVRIIITDFSKNKDIDIDSVGNIYAQ